jgi:hypothetical protein
MGCAVVAAWCGAAVFVLGVGGLGLIVITERAGPFGIAALYAGVAVAGGLLALAIAIAGWLVRRLRTRGAGRWRLVAAGLASPAAVALLATGVAGSFGPVDPEDHSDLALAAGVTLLVLAGVVAAPRPERAPAAVSAAAWIFLVAGLGYRAWTDTDVRVVWLGPATDGADQIAFNATRSGDFEIRVDAPSCGDGRTVAAGRYEHLAGDPGSAYGAAIWVDLPDDALPLERGDLVRVCLRDGLAAGTAAAEVVAPPSFWPRD